MDHQEAFLKRPTSLLPLPQYMCPAVTIPIDNLLLTNRVKRDRLAIKHKPLQELKRARITPILRRQISGSNCCVKIVYRSHLLLRRIRIFLLIRGNFLFLVKLQALIRDSFDVALRLVDFMNASTLRLIVSVISKSGSIHFVHWAVEKTHKSCRLGDNVLILLTGSLVHLGRHLPPRLVAD